MSKYDTEQKPLNISVGSSGALTAVVSTPIPADLYREVRAPLPAPRTTAELLGEAKAVSDRFPPRPVAVSITAGPLTHQAMLDATTGLQPSFGPEGRADIELHRSQDLAEGGVLVTYSDGTSKWVKS